MKVLRPIAAIICWISAYTIIGFLGSKGMTLLSRVIDTQSTFGFILFLAISLPIIASVNFYACLMSGLFFIQTKTQALVVLLVCGIWEVLLFAFNPGNVVNWALGASTILTYLMLFLGKLGESKHESKKTT